MLMCCDCGFVFDEDDAESKEICLEDEYGVSSLFHGRAYRDIMICPECGCEELDDYFEDEEEDETE